ncbi:MAG: phytanoyl-CoA dioxygenase family protein, partial [Alphaproteobacteria bacterium]
FVVKEPRTSGIFAMHQDRFEWHLEPMEVIHCWLAFTDSTPENGCMRAVPGTHLMGELVHVPDEDKDNVVSYAKKAVGFDESRAVDLVLRAGEMSMHDAGTVHASGPNRTDDKRVGYIMRFMPPHVRPVCHPRNSVTLVRGVDRLGHWELEPRPARELDPACLAVYESLHATHAPTRFKYM